MTQLSFALRASALKNSALVIGLGIGLVHAAGVSASNWEITFEEFDHGQIIDDEYTSASNPGPGLSGAGQLAPGLDVTFSARSLPSGAPGSLNAVVFDSADPALRPTNDPDLEAPFAPAPGSNVGIGNPGNILILHEEEGTFHSGTGGPCNAFVCEDPDDIRSRPAGEFTIEFSDDVYVESIDFFDIEIGNHEPGYLQLVDAADNIIGQQHTIPETGDHMWDRFVIPDGGAFEVRKIIVKMGGSGALDNIVGRFAPRQVPEPAPLGLIAIGALALAGRARRR